MTGKKLIISLFVALTLGAAVLVPARKVYADCEPNYGGGETCIYNKRFKIEKEVRVEGDNSWKDKVTDVEKDQTVEFKIKIKNISDEDTPLDFDNMKMKDSLPDEMNRVGGSGLTEYWDNFKPGESKTFVIKAKVNSDEFDRADEFEKCVVNKAEAFWDGKFEGSDTATVCYGNVTLKELPKTGFVPVTAIVGLGLVLAGSLIRFSKRFA